MSDAAPLGTADLRARMRDGIARRLDAETAEERARAGAELLDVLREIRRREGARPGKDGHHDRDPHEHPARHRDVRTDSSGLHG